MKKLVAVLVCSTIASTSLFGMRSGRERVEEPDGDVASASMAVAQSPSSSSSAVIELPEADQATLARENEQVFKVFALTAKETVAYLGQSNKNADVDGLTSFSKWLDAALVREVAQRSLSESTGYENQKMGNGSAQITVSTVLLEAYNGASQASTIAPSGPSDQAQERTVRLRVASSVARQFSNRSSHWTKVVQQWPQFAQDWIIFAEFVDAALDRPLRLDAAKRFLEQFSLATGSKMVAALRATYDQTATLTGAPRLDTPKSSSVRVAAFDSQFSDREAGSSRGAGESSSSLSPEMLDGILGKFRAQILQETAAKAREDFVDLAKDLQERLNAAFDGWMRDALSKTAQ